METQEILFKHKRKLFNREGGQTLQQVTQRGCRVSIIEDAQIPNGQGPEQPAQGDPALSWGLDQRNSRDVFQSHLFCDFMILPCFESLTHMQSGNRFRFTFVSWQHAIVPPEWLILSLDIFPCAHTVQKYGGSHLSNPNQSTFSYVTLLTVFLDQNHSVNISFLIFFSFFNSSFNQLQIPLMLSGFQSQYLCRA